MTKADDSQYVYPSDEPRQAKQRCLRQRRTNRWTVNAIQQELRHLRNAAPSADSIHRLSSLLDSYRGRWPILDLIPCYQQIWKELPEEARSGSDPDWRDIIDGVSGKVKSAVSAMADLFHPDSSRPAILDALNTKYLSHAAVRSFVRDFDLGLDLLQDAKQRVVVALPSGPTFALACLAVSSCYTLVPMNLSPGVEQFKADLTQARATAVLVLEADMQKLELNAPWVHAAGIAVFIVHPLEDLTFDVSSADGDKMPGHTIATANSPDDLAVILFTSGTSGIKKLVPITTFNLMASVAFTIESQGLTVQDCCLNIMPLYHM